MKKTIILVALMLLGDMRLSAQAPILPLDTNLYYDWWWYDDLMSDTAQYIYTNVADGSYTGDSNYDASGHDVGFVRRGFWHYQAVIGGGTFYCGELAKYFHTDTALSILGIRVCPWRCGNYEDPGVGGHTGDFFEFWDYSLDTMVLSNSFVSLYKRVEDSMLLLGRKHLGYDNLFPYKSWMYTTLRYLGSGNTECNAIVEDDREPFREYYFDQPITVEDSFYIAITLFPDSIRPVGVDRHHYAIISPELAAYSQTAPWSRDFPCPNISRNFPALRYRCRFISVNEPTPEGPYRDTYTSLGWHDTAVKSCVMIFPIVKYGSVYANCTPVEGLHVIKQDDATFYFEWSDSTRSHLGWEFTYVPDGSSPDGGAVVDCSEAYASATVEPGILYRAYVRPRCVANRYGDWGTGEPFCYNCQPNAINTSDTSISLHPNPTFSVIEVASQKPIQLIEVFDTRGTLVFNTYPGPGVNTAQVDLSPYSDGVYMIKVHTSIGIATKQAIKMKSD